MPGWHVADTSYHVINICWPECGVTLINTDKVSKFINVLAPPPLNHCVSFCRHDAAEAGASVRGDCAASFKKTAFGQSAFSVRAAVKLNSIPTYMRDCTCFKQSRISMYILYDDLNVMCGLLMFAFCIVCFVLYSLLFLCFPAQELQMQISYKANSGPTVVLCMVPVK